MGFEAKIEEIRQTARAADRAAETVRGVNAAASLPTGDAGMPGARAVGKLDAVRQLWQQIQDGTAGELTAHGESVNSAADLYASSDQAAGEALSDQDAPSSPNKPV